MFRFTIRDILWMMVVAALALGWWAHSRHLESEWSARLKSQQQAYKNEYASLKRQANAAGFKLLNPHGAPFLIRADAAPDISE